MLNFIGRQLDGKIKLSVKHEIPGRCRQ